MIRSEQEEGVSGRGRSYSPIPPYIQPYIRYRLSLAHMHTVLAWERVASTHTATNATKQLPCIILTQIHSR